MKYFIFSFLFLSGIYFSACTSHSKTAESAPTNSTPLPADVVKLFSEILPVYFQLKNNLVASNASTATKSATDLSEKLSVLEKSLTQNALTDTSLEHANIRLQTAGKALASAANLEQQRSAFSVFSNELAAWVTKYPLSNTPVYQQFCPMAFDGKGAYWLSEEKKIMNPYFGDEMLHCGKVVKQF